MDPLGTYLFPAAIMPHHRYMTDIVNLMVDNTDLERKALHTDLFLCVSELGSIKPNGTRHRPEFSPKFSWKLKTHENAIFGKIVIF